MRVRKIIQRLFILLLSICYVLFVPPGGVADEKKDAGKITFTFSKKRSVPKKKTAFSLKNSLETKYTIIQYNSLKALKEFDGEIDYSPAGKSLKELFSGSGSTDRMTKIKIKIDALYERAQEILDMQKRMEKVTINVYLNKEELGKAYQMIYGTKLRARAWYLLELKTVFINADDVFEGMLAHEMAHHIIDHFLTVRPPRASAEILATYVDAHLFKKTRKY